MNPEIWEVNDLLMTEDHEVYLAGRGYVKVKDLKIGDVIINETNGKTNRVRVLNPYLESA